MAVVATGSTPQPIKQLSFFIPNRLAALQRAVAALAEHAVKICAISIIDAADHAVVRLVVDRPAAALQALRASGHSVFESELLGVALPPVGAARREGIREVLASLLVAEVKVEYIYALIEPWQGRPVLALHVDDRETAARVLQGAGLTVVGQGEIGPGDGS
ncbi:MAG: amino acid-binding protein [Planctomycetota bacterium]|nr:MAG: amino acid-binding protein [Planctomycetota bacterium]